ncbi:MAG TPA: efflux RND transporter periplasmic adaptor subunit [Gemmatimonadaceae bacterium]|nr:efflux RND transporter periplasmic adaptor subunit [Gemmatimonadaceae bacterium]
MSVREERVAGSGWRVGALGIVALVSVTATACSKKGGTEDARAESTATPATVTIGQENVAVVKQSTIQTGPTLSGSLAPEKEAAIRAQVGGTVLQTYVDEGQRVTAGTPLVRLDDAAVRDAALGARSGVASARAQAEVAQRNLQRAEQLLAAGAIAERDVESARSANVAAQAQLANARALQASAEKNLGNTYIRAPFAGVVAQRSVNAGDVVQPGGALVTVVQPSSMRLEASVPAEQLSSVRVGMPVQFSVSGYPGRTFDGRITRVAPVADPATRQVRIIASIPNDRGGLVGGLFAEGRVSSESRSAAVVPLNAVDQRGLAPFVMRLKGGRAEKTEVKLGIQDATNETVEIVSGLAAGDTVLVGAAQGISAGTPVKVGVITDRTAQETR